MKKIDYLESLRGLAAFVVVIAHFVVAFYPALYWARPDQVHTEHGVELAISGTPLNLLYNGDFSVAIFFVLSGFVLSYKFHRDRSAPTPLIPLAVKRYVRLLVPVLFSITLAFVLLKLSLMFNHRVSVLSKSSDWLGTYWQFAPEPLGVLRESFFGVFFGRTSLYNSVLWTMTYEFYGSLIVYGFVALFRNQPRRPIAYVLLLIALHRTYYAAFLLGVLLSDWYCQEGNFLKSIRNRWIFAGMLLLGLFAGSYPTARTVDGTVYSFLQTIARPRSFHIIGAFLVMTAVLHLGSLQRVLSKKLFVFLGKVSFSLYIVHFLIIGSLSSWLMLTLASRFSYHAAFAMTFAVSLPVIMAVSYVTYRLVDTGGIRLSQAVFQSTLGFSRKYDLRKTITNQTS